MNLTTGNRQTTQRTGVVLLRLEHAQHALAHRRHGADVSNFFTLYRLENILSVEAFVQYHCSAEIDGSQCERTAGVEINRRRENRLVVDAEAFFDGVVDTVKNEAPLRRETAFRKPCGAGCEQNRKRVVLVNFDCGFVATLARQQTAVT